MLWYARQVNSCQLCAPPAVVDPLDSASCTGSAPGRPPPMYSSSNKSNHGRSTGAMVLNCPSAFKATVTPLSAVVSGRDQCSRDRHPIMSPPAARSQCVHHPSIPTAWVRRERAPERTFSHGRAKSNLLLLLCVVVVGVVG